MSPLRFLPLQFSRSSHCARLPFCTPLTPPLSQLFLPDSSFTACRTTRALNHYSLAHLLPLVRSWHTQLTRPCGNAPTMPVEAPKSVCQNECARTTVHPFRRSSGPNTRPCSADSPIKKRTPHSSGLRGLHAANRSMKESHPPWPKLAPRVLQSCDYGP
jgi:hypothetical protein